MLRTLTPNRTLKVTPNGKVFKKAKQKKSCKGEIRPKTNGILDIKHKGLSINGVTLFRAKIYPLPPLVTFRHKYLNPLQI